MKTESEFEKYVLIDDLIMDLDEKTYESMMKMDRSTPLVNKDELPDSYILPISSIKSQGSIGSCTGMAATAALETLVLIHKGKNDDLSETFSYMVNKKYDPWSGEGYSGSSTNTAGRMIRDKGICHETLRPYIKKEYVKLSREMYLDAKKRTCKQIHYVDYTNEEFKNHLCNNHPILIGIKMFSKFYSPLKDGYITSYGRKKRGGHAICIFGYERIGKNIYYHIKNSWSTRYGKGGICKIKDIVLFKALKTAIAIDGLNEDYELGYNGTLVEPKKDPTPSPKKKRRRRRWYNPWSW